MKERLLIVGIAVTLAALVAFNLALVRGAYAQAYPLKVINVKMLPGSPIVVLDCKVDTAGGYWRSNHHLEDEFTDWLKANGGTYYDEVPSDAELGQKLKETLRQGKVVTISPDSHGIFITEECQK